MTLSLDDVRNKRFRLARKSGYEVAEVDDFLDQLQESFAQLIEENETLKKQLDSLGSDQPAPVAEPSVDEPAPREVAEPETIIVTASTDASAAVVRLVQMSTEQAERLVAEATADAERIRSEADSSAHQLDSETRAEAERLEAEAREKAESLRADAQSQAEQLNAETAQRRQQLFGDLETERGLLSSAIEDLRRFEEAFRTNMSDHLRRQLSVLESGSAEPADAPELAPAAGGSATAAAAGGAAAAAQPAAPVTDEAVADQTGGDDDDADDELIETDPDATVQVSDTPRLDALLGDQR